MANYTVSLDALVTPTSSDLTSFSWTYSLNGAGFQAGPVQLAQLDNGDSADITINLIAGGSDADICRFQTAPLTFFRPTDPPTFYTPQWYDAPQGGTSQIQFSIQNNNSERQVYRFWMNGSYTAVAQNLTVPVTSPDPTIVNAATDGGTGIPLPDDGSRVRRDSTAVAA